MTVLVGTGECTKQGQVVFLRPPHDELKGRVAAFKRSAKRRLVTAEVAPTAGQMVSTERIDFARPFCETHRLGHA